MSTIRKKPFIQTLVEDLSPQQKAALLGVVNGSGSTVNASFADMPEDAVASVLFKFSEIDSKTGILIQSTNYTVLIAYHRFQDLLMIKLNSNHTYEKINEYLNINELRRVLGPKTIFTSKIKEMTDEQLNSLNVGDTVVKITGNQAHAYIVSYKENYTGICMTYTDASGSETQSYDYTEGHWVYNSQDNGSY